MEIIESSWRSPEGLNLYTRTWTPEAEAKASVVLVHGLGEHCARYDHVGQAFTACNVLLTSFDLPGHGRSEGKRGHISSYDAVADDIDHFLSAQDRSKPVFLYGHSMGGLIVLYYAIKRQPAIAGVISTSPGLGTAAPVPPAKMTLGRLLNRIAPAVALDNGLDRNNLSHDENVVRAYSADPLVTPLISARLGITLFDTAEWVFDHIAQLALPVLLMQGGQDHIVSVEKTRQFAHNAPAGRVTYREWEDLFHETHNEFAKDQVIRAMLDWIEKRIGEETLL